MFESLEVFRMSSAMARHAGQRQALVAQNMANVNTPGYQARHLPSFTDLAADVATQGGDASNTRATRPTHLHGAGERTVTARPEYMRDNAAPDGNTASVEREMLESVAAGREHDRALAIYKSALKVLHSTLARS